MEPTKREFRQLKREIKRAGSQHRRRQWKRDLRDNPEEAPYSEERFGRFSTAELNGNDKPRVRETPRREEPPLSDTDGPVEASDVPDRA
jgi:hypothetical protein